jgi:hypothetical protein
MQSNILITKSSSKNINSKNLGSADIFVEMENMGIDSTPFIEIAAIDIKNQFGDATFKYSNEIEQNFIDRGDLSSASIWAKFPLIYAKLKLIKNLNLRNFSRNKPAKKSSKQCNKYCHNTI